MTDDQNSENATLTEKQLLMQRARLMGIKFSNNITEDALRAKIAEKLGGEQSEADEADEDADNDGIVDAEDDQVDADGDGHDDRDGQFVDGNQEASSGAQEREPGIGSLSGPANIAEALATATIEPETAPAPVQALASAPASVVERLNPLLDTPTAAPIGAEASPVPTRRLSKIEAKNALRHSLIREAMALVRVRITNLNPSKKDLPGEILTVANRYIGTVKKYVPYGEVTDNGYHIPKCIYDQLVERRFQNIRTVKDKRTGTPRVESSWAKEFAIEVLPQLTAEELKDLALAQAAAGSIDNQAG